MKCQRFDAREARGSSWVFKAHGKSERAHMHKELQGVLDNENGLRVAFRKLSPFRA